SIITIFEVTSLRKHFHSHDDGLFYSGSRFWGIAEATIEKAQAKWLENTRDFPSEEIPLGYRLRSPLPPGEEPCPLSLAYGFYATQPSPRGIKCKKKKRVML
ncbi:unnamed protein product, partial [marine sediment metagenome]